MDPYAKQQERHSMLAVNNGATDNQRGPMHRKKPKDYKPRPIRWPTLFFFALILAACIGLIEMLFATTKDMPHSGSQNQARSIDAAPEQLFRRADGDCTKLPALSASFSSADQVVVNACSVFTQSYSGKKLQNASQTSNFQQWSSAFSQQDRSRASLRASMTAANDDCWEYQMTTMAGYQALPTPTTTFYQGCKTTFGTDACPPGIVTVTVNEYGTITEATLTVGCSVSKSKLLTLKAKPTSTDPNSPTTAPNVVSGGNSASMVQGSPTQVASASPVTFTSEITATSIIVTTGGDGIVYSSTSVSVQKSVITSKSRASATSGTATQSRGNVIPTSTNSPNMSAFVLSTYEKYVDRPFTIPSYLAAMYLPSILAVLIRVIWEMIQSAFKLVEPFHRLSARKGASATRSLFAQYLSASVSWDAIGSCFNGHALTAVTTIVYFAVTLLASLATSSMTVRGTDVCDVEGGETMICNPVWIVQAPILRAVEGLLILCFALTFFIIVLSKWYRTGLSTSPSSIASIATLVNQNALVRDFRSVDPVANDAGLVSAIKGERCWLGHHQHSMRGSLYGIGRRVDASSSSPQTSHPPQSWHNGYTMVANPALPPPHGSKSRKTGLAFLNTIQLISSMGILALVVGFRFDPNDDAFNRFFGSGTWYAEFTFVACASIVDMQWKRLERQVRITEPYRRMSKGFAPPETTVLMSLHGSCWSSFFSSATKMFTYKDMWFQTLVSFVAVLSDFNIIAFASVVYTDAQTLDALIISSAVAIAISGLMVIVMLITIFWWSKGIVTKMPRSPDTVGAVFSYLCASRFAQEMGSAQLENMSQKQRDNMIIATGWRFWFGWRVGIDGVERWMVDFESPNAVRT